MRSTPQKAKILNEIKQKLESRKQEIYSEISQYPPPIPACDAQFNYLLELRNCVNQELSQINGLLNAQTTQDDSAMGDLDMEIASFVQASTVLKNKVKREIQHTLHEVSV